jgi:hypothetical protein
MNVPNDAPIDNVILPPPEAPPVEEEV